MLNELEQKLYDISVHEIENREWGVTQQYLGVMKVATENGKPKLVHVEYRDEVDVIALYFKIEDESFYFTTFFKTIPEVELNGIDITPGNGAYLYVSSDALDLKDILLKTSINPTETWQKGEKTKSDKWENAESGFILRLYDIEADAGDFEVKILQLLKTLETHKLEILELQNHCSIDILTYLYNYIRNSMLVGFSLDKEILRLLHELNLEIQFDLYVGGEPFKSGDE